MIALPEDLCNSVLVLSVLPTPFSDEGAAALLAHPLSSVQRRGLLRRLVALGMLVWRPGRRLYTMPPAVRDAAAALSSLLGEPRMGRGHAPILAGAQGARVCCG